MGRSPVYPVTALFIAEPPSVSCCGAGFLMGVGVDVKGNLCIACLRQVLFWTALGVMSLASSAGAPRGHPEAPKAHFSPRHFYLANGPGWCGGGGGEGNSRPGAWNPTASPEGMSSLKADWR
jgi:hypothetical protein